ncbi:hypothetical protein GU926_05005 [Nibribacter ruber]|uniref:Toxin-antitoxin system YwqK family antitoxin n=1 Tax=Nibribacter ruber TaxID=2698458 RepID=A0A6P1NXA5_9BACT|nr:toxin-antitoxin system YwqK family antitoxin [Nibribacter ruber]QHL86829.1 hypothetical protein GU926_05005 [Nibribacter ruber]
MKVLTKILFAFLLTTALGACGNERKQGASKETIVRYPSGAVKTKTQLLDGVSLYKMTEFYENGKLHGVQYTKDGKRDSTFLELQENGDTIMVASARNDEPHGEVIEYFPNGKRHKVMHYADGVANGMVERYFENGQKEFELNHKNGKFHGIMKVYNQDGSLKEERLYENHVEIWRKDAKGLRINPKINTSHLSPLVK